MSNKANNLLQKLKDKERKELILQLALLAQRKKTNTLAYLSDIIGFDATLRLVTALGGSQLHIPKPETLLSSFNLAGAVAEAHLEGVSADVAAKEYGVSTKAVNALLKRLEALDDEMSKIRAVGDKEIWKIKGS